MIYGEYQATQVAKASGKPTKIQTDTYGNIITVGGTGASANQVQGVAASGAVNLANPILAGAIVEAAPAATGLADGDIVNLKTDGRGYLWTTIGVGGSTAMSSAAFADASSNTQTRLLTAAFGLDFNGTTWDRVRKPNATHRLLSSAATTNATSVKATAGDLVRIRGYTAAAAAVFLKLYNKATAPTVGTDTPVQTIRLAPTALFDLAFDREFFSLGIAYAITGAAASGLPTRSPGLPPTRTLPPLPRATC